LRWQPRKWCCSAVYRRSVHQHLSHGPLSCRQRRLQACFGRCVRARGLSCGMQSRCDVVTTQGLGGWRALAASKVVLQCCLTEISIVHQHLGHGPLSCRQRRLQACFGRCVQARGLACGMQSRCDVVTTQGLDGWRALAASKVVLQCSLYSRSVHQHLSHGPLSCRQRRLQACFGRCVCARGLSCGMQSRCDVITT